MIFDTKVTHFKAIWIAIMMLGMHSGLWAKDGLDNVYIFGDSLSDPGNVYALTGQTAKAPYEPIPSAAYAIGGHQFSNGKTWAQRFAQNPKLNKSGKAAYGSSGKFGSETGRPILRNRLPNLTYQQSGPTQWKCAWIVCFDAQTLS